MGYFANGTEAEFYEAQWCDLCIHSLDGACPIMSLHQDYQDERQNNEAVANILDKLIPVDEHKHNAACAMFAEIGDESEPAPAPVDTGMTPEQVRAFWVAEAQA